MFLASIPISASSITVANVAYLSNGLLLIPLALIEFTHLTALVNKLSLISFNPTDFTYLLFSI